MKAIVVKVSISSPGLKSERFLKKLKRYEQMNKTVTLLSIVVIFPEKKKFTNLGRSVKG